MGIKYRAKMAEPQISDSKRLGGLSVLAAALTLGVFLADIRAESGISLSALYVVPVLLGLWAPSARFTVVVALVGTVLSSIDPLFSPSSNAMRLALINRPLMVVAIWSTAFVVLRYRQAAAVVTARTWLVREYLDVAGVAILALDTEGRVTLINRRGLEMLGCAESDVIGENWFTRFLPEDVRGEVHAYFLSLMRDDATPPDVYENDVLRFNGARRRIAWQTTLLRGADGRIRSVLCSGDDVTDRRRTQEELLRSSKEAADLKYAIDQAAIVAITDTAGVIRYANDKFCEISGYSREELLGQDHRLINSGYHPKEFIRELWVTIANGRVWRGEIRNRAKSGAFYWVDTTIVPFLDEGGRPYQYLAIRSDITERKRQEATLREQAALTRLGEMAAIVAHEIRNPLAGIRGVLQIIGTRMPEASRDRMIVGDVVARLDSLNELVQDLLLFARPRPPQLTVVDVRPLIESTVQLLRKDPNQARVDVELGGENVQLLGDPEMLRSVFMNLLLNAAQAMAGHGKIAVEIARTNGHCRVRIVDQGPGIEPGVRERMFEPFYTTKHRGTGLGLPTARKLLQAHGGDVEVECPDSGGTIMTVSLPLSQPTG